MKSIKFIFLALLATLAIASCKTESKKKNNNNSAAATNCPSPSPTYNNGQYYYTASPSPYASPYGLVATGTVQQVLTAKCVSCHNSTNMNKINLSDSYTAQSRKSDIYSRVVKLDTDPLRMPKTPAARLPQEEINLLTAWLSSTQDWTFNTSTTTSTYTNTYTNSYVYPTASQYPCY